MHTRPHFSLPASIRRWFERLTLVDVLVLIATVAMLLALLLPDSSTAARGQIEERILGWQPSDEDKTEPSSEFVFSDMDIVGNWSVRRHFNSRSLRIKKLPSGKYEVMFSTGGCLGHFETERNGEFQSGTLSLHKPVAEYMPAVYQKLYAVRVGDADYLLPAAFVSRFQAAFSSDVAVVDKSKIDLWVYRRSDELP